LIADINPKNERTLHAGLPVAAIVGRPNVGKSALFNRLIGKRRAIVAEEPGVTRDINYGPVSADGLTYLVADSAGYGAKNEPMSGITLSMNRDLIARASCVVLVCDAQALTGDDFKVADQVRRSGKPVVLAVNKADNPASERESCEFFRLGLGDPVPVSAAHGRNIDFLKSRIGELLREQSLSQPNASAEPAAAEPLPAPIPVAIVGKPNVGKSSLLNLLVDSQRSMVSAEPGTTRDTVSELIRHGDQYFALLDTAGLRRRGKIRENVEYYSSLRARDAVRESTVCVLLVDAQEGITSQDKKIAALIMEEQKGLILAANKWDLVQAAADEREYIADIRALFPHLAHARFITLSARTGYNKTNLLRNIAKVYTNYYRSVKTSILNEYMSGLNLRQAQVKYGVQTRVGPPRFEFFMRHTEPDDENFKKFIANRIRTYFDFQGVPLEIDLRNRK
jgi:GTP-binding protein